MPIYAKTEQFYTKIELFGTKIELFHVLLLQKKNSSFLRKELFQVKKGHL